MRSRAAGPLVGLGLVYGAGAGLIIGLAVAGPTGLAPGLVIGAGLGAVAGNVAELGRTVVRRQAHRPETPRGLHRHRRLPRGPVHP
ncbi:MAG: hypothetical protein Q7T31_09160 [Dietzia sp.]|uniref:hypothetical protein n=1 Tax=Dietzia TaxID=37914 RepID=UPI0015FB3C3E|nr:MULTISPECIES: hypothetical protein [Dietzia]MBB1036333.1 hypothetical protein [Dietzia sp. CQ4]MBB1038381.1 hypothetical protein [Dietzia natronolimnaea]MBB1042326.1 hypothetical protein [Dietzia sp. Cai40]MBB1045623.1 hypothetical protein [Dietzia sp. DQ11-44]MBB1049203.1 hypothetical protein [Dietzia cercidiphylli]